MWSGRSQPSVQLPDYYINMIMSELQLFKQESGVALRGQGDRLALLRLYDEMDDHKKQELLRFAVLLARREQSCEINPGRLPTS